MSDMQQGWNWETSFETESSKDEIYCYWDRCTECKHSQPSGNAYCSNCGRRDKKLPIPPYERKTVAAAEARGRRERDDQYRDIFDWLSGTNGDFPDLSQKPHYKFRTELRERLGLLDTEIKKLKS